MIVCLKMFFFRLECTCEETCESVWPPNSSLYASSTCVQLRLLAGPFDQGFSYDVCRLRASVQLKTLSSLLKWWIQIIKECIYGLRNFRSQFAPNSGEISVKNIAYFFRVASWNLVRIWANKVNWIALVFLFTAQEP